MHDGARMERWSHTASIIANLAYALTGSKVEMSAFFPEDLREELEA